MKLILFISTLLFSISASNEILKWTDSDGKVHFGDRLPPDAETSVVEVRINTYETAGSVMNTATASGLDDPDPTIANPVDSPPADALVTAVQNPELSIVKTASPLTYAAVGEVITYSYRVTNSAPLEHPSR